METGLKRGGRATRSITAKVQMRQECGRGRGRAVKVGAKMAGEMPQMEIRSRNANDCTVIARGCVEQEKEGNVSTRRVCLRAGTRMKEASETG